jgi:hypothetical protein
MRQRGTRLPEITAIRRQCKGRREWFACRDQHVNGTSNPIHKIIGQSIEHLDRFKTLKQGINNSDIFF